MRILYLSCHEILEFDEVKLFHELGHEVFSPGAYVEPANRGDEAMRPGIADMKANPDDLALWHQITATDDNVRKCSIPRSFLDRFDVVIVMHIPDWITHNWNSFLGKKVIWRTIGQSVAYQEQKLRPYRAQGLNIVRYSPKEETIPFYIGADAMIRFYKDPDEFGGWNGNEKYVITFNQSMPLRGPACNYPLYRAVTDGLPRKLYGPGNESAGDFNQGKVSYPDLKKAMQDHRAYFYVGTHPASYTLNYIEAAMTGIPIIAIGPEWGNAKYFQGHDLYEMPELIENGANGFISDDVGSLRKYCELMLRDHKLAKQVGAAGRAAAIKTFGKPTIKEQWRQYLESLC